MEREDNGYFALRYKTPEELQAAIDAYFVNETRPTMSGLSRFLGFKKRDTLYAYKSRDGFGDVVTDARLRIEQYYEENLMDKTRVIGSIFALKQLGWRDRQDVQVGGELSIPVIEWVKKVSE